MQQPTDEKLTKWLNKLQQESWQLELVVSGFAIFLMIGALEALRNLGPWINLQTEGLQQDGMILSLGYGIAVGTCFFLLVNLVLHVLLRGIWISTIGLRYVSGDIDFEKLRLTDRFDRFLRQKIKSFDHYISGLENICSVVFAFTFLIVFMLIAVGMYLIFTVLFLNLEKVLLEKVFGDTAVEILLIASFIFLLAIGLVYFLDFLTLGFLKRIKWFSRFYFPFYRFYSLITLSFLYRPIYYNLIDNRFGRRVGFLLVPYVLFVWVLAMGRIDSYLWFPVETGNTMLDHNRYDDLRVDKEYIVDGSIPSKFVENGFLELFFRYKPSTTDPVLMEICPDHKPVRETGFGTNIHFSINEERQFQKESPDPDSVLSCMSQLYRIKVADSVFQQPHFHFYQHPNKGELGLLALLDVHYLPRGRYEVSVSRQVFRNDSLQWRPYFSIPFWKSKE